MAMTFGWVVMATVSYSVQKVKASQAKKMAVTMTDEEWAEAEARMFPMSARYLSPEEQAQLVALHAADDTPRYLKDRYDEGTTWDDERPPAYSRNAVDHAAPRREDIDFGEEDEVIGTRERVKKMVERITAPLDPLRRAPANSEPIKQRGGHLRCRCPDCMALRSRGRPRSPVRDGESRDDRRRRKIDEFRRSGRYLNGGWNLFTGKNLHEIEAAAA